MRSPLHAATVVSALAIACAACNARLIKVAPDGGEVDATGDDDGDGPIISIDAPPDAPLCTSGRVVWMAFDGVNIAHAGTSDATAATPQASWTGLNQAAIPAFEDGNANRQADIDSITQYIGGMLAPYHIQVVTTRPAQGPYILIAVGGDSNDAGTNFSGAVDRLDCGDANKNDVAWVSSQLSFIKIEDYSIGAIGYGIGLTGTNNSGDCMCSWNSNCSQNPGHCTLSGTINTNGECSGQNTQDEGQAFSMFCNP